MEAFGCDRRRSPSFDWYFDCNSAAASLVRSIFTVYKRSPYSAFKAYQTRSFHDGEKKDKELGFCSTCLKMIHMKGYLVGAQPSRCCSFAHRQAQPIFKKNMTYAKKNAGFHSFKAVASVASACKGSESVLAAATTLEKLLPFKMACNFDQRHKWSWRVIWGISSSWKLLPEPRQDQCHGCHRSLAQIDERNKSMNESSCLSSCVSKISMKKYEEPSQLPASRVFFLKPSAI